MPFPPRLHTTMASLAAAWAIGAAILGACASTPSATDRAFADGQARMEAREWAQAIDSLKAVVAQSRALPDKQASRAHVMMSRAQLELGRPATALASFDDGVRAAPAADQRAMRTQRGEIQRRFLATLDRPATAHLRLAYRERLPPGYHLVSIQVVFDEQVVLDWRATPDARPAPVAGAVLGSRPLVPGDHYVRFVARYWVAAAPAYKFRVSSAKVIDCREGHLCDVSITAVDPFTGRLDIETPHLHKPWMAISERLTVQVQATETRLGAALVPGASAAP